MSPFVAMKTAKDELRQRMRELRLALPAGQAELAGAQAAAHFHEIHGSDGAAVVALYAAMRNEVDTRPLAAVLRARGARICYPRVLPGRLLNFHETAEAELVTTRLGIPEPPAGAPTIDPTDIDIFVVPGLAFDPNGVRLGWGRGHYDNALAAAPQALRVGLAHAFQVLPHVPDDRHDVRMDWLLTEQEAKPTGARPPTLRRVR
jgi:5-formyltetrahydrofolate cyclo-ligase